MEKCLRCDGCGKLASTDDQEPWKVWEEMPEESKLAVKLGLVHPITCPDCGGTGENRKYYCPNCGSQDIDKFRKMADDGEFFYKCRGCFIKFKFWK